MKIIQAKQSPNYSTHPDGKPKEYIKIAVIMHKTVGSFEGALNWLSTTPEDRLLRHGKKTWSSAHSLDRRNDPGVIHQLMPWQFRAWHAGGVTRRTDRAIKVIGVRDPNNVTIGHEMTAYYDIDRDGTVEPEEKKATINQLDDFVNLMFHLEEESKTNPWIDIKADADHLLTHADTNHHKPDMEWEYAYVVEQMRKRKNTQPNCPLALKDSNLKQTVDHLINLLNNQ